MKNKFILGLDIGGANTKAALVEFYNSKIIHSFSYIEYFPFWENTLNDIPNMFKRIVENLIIKNNLKLDDINYIAITITAELSDAFQTKQEGIFTILNALDQVFEKGKLFFVNNKKEFISFNQAKTDPISVAAANWVSTSLFLGRYVPNCVLIDAGSTTIDIIPILNSVPVAKGENDIERIISHELVYTGGLRATIPSITHFVPYKGKMVRISFEKFALISDVHRVLKNISEAEYINDTADNRSKSLNNCYARLARMICMDLDSISIKDLDLIAQYIYNKQIKIVLKEFLEFLKGLTARYPVFNRNPRFVLTGLSADFLIKPALKELGYEKILNYELITNIPDNISSSAFAVAGAYYFQSIKN
ncbi:MAG: H4MPT-linked C1 transfer pathway protein [Candidatus Lokiarchaeota archaeon]|nr:H4MPT-linked C1 transfer pathway protein [Candidatus Lokiarchaeota archaeon]